MADVAKFDPITEGFGTQPPVYPAGFSIADKISIKTIKRRIADAIYENYHSYIPRGRLGWHYGILLDGELVGAITFSTWPAPANLRGHDSDDIIEVSRVCVANETPNLASCAMSKAQDKFIEEEADEYGVTMLVTYIHSDWEGSMFKALRGKGWEFDEYREMDGTGGSNYTAGEDNDEIQSVNKDRWLCEI